MNARPAATLACTLLLAASGSACTRRAAAPVMLPASTVAVDAPAGLLFAPPLALAVPEDAVVRVVGPQMTCSGTLVEDDLVLTAHHCVVARGKNGEFTRNPIDASALRIELGGDYLAWGTAGVRAIVAPPCGEAGGAGDVAIVVLDHRLVGIGTMAPRLDAPPKIGEGVDPIGFGRCALSGDGIRRRERGGGSVRATTGETLIVNASVCPGDSGGPVLARGSREIVGVISLSAMDGDERTASPTVIARIDAYRRVFAAARLIADGAEPGDLPPLTCEP